MRRSQPWEEHRKGAADLGGSRCVPTAVRESGCAGASAGGRAPGAERSGRESLSRRPGRGAWPRIHKTMADTLGVRESWGALKVYLFNLLF